MKKILLVISVIGITAAGFMALVSDRDRGMWVMNSAMKLARSFPVSADIAYGSQTWQKLDVYPAEATDRAAPVLVFIHGGSWRHGRKDQYYFAADAFRRLGYTVVLPDYIKHPAPEAKFPAHIIDGAKAIAWVKTNIADHNGDPENIFVAGHSAGAHSAALIATDEQYLESEGLSKNDIRGFAGMAGPYGFTPDWYVTEAVFGPPSNYPLMNPLNYVDGTEPSTLLLHSVADQQVKLANQVELSKKIRAAGGDVETIVYQGMSHIDVVTHLHPWFAGEASVAKDIDRFFKSRMKSG